jgi:hypothetical protein
MTWSYTWKILKTPPKLLDLMNTFSKVSGYKMNAFQFTNNEQSEKEIRKQYNSQ